MDFSALLQAAPQVLRDLPFLISTVQLVFYAGLALTFGGYVIRGYRGHISGRVRLAGRLSLGALALVCGIGISWVLPLMSDAYAYQLIQRLFVNTIIGGIIATAVLFLAVRLASHNIFNVAGIEGSIEDLKRLKKRAEEAGKRDRSQNRQGIRHPVRMTGLALLAGFLVVSLAGFRGFPSPMEEMGLNQEELRGMADQMEQINQEYGDQLGSMANPECMGAVDILQDQNAIEGAESYRSPLLERLIMEETGEGVQSMLRVESGERDYVVSLTSSFACISTTEELCMCTESGDGPHL